MKIAMISEHASPLATLGSVDAGGQNVHVAALATALGAAGHRVEVFTRRDSANVPTRVAFRRNVVVEHVPAGPPEDIAKDELFAYMPEFADVVAERLPRLKPHVVHSHFWMSGWVAINAAALHGIPVVHTYHALGATKRRHQGVKDTSPPHRVEIECDLARRCEQIVATSSEEVFELRRMGATPTQVSLVPCGVDVAHFAPAPLRRVDRGRRPRILVVSRLVERKGIDNVIESLANVPDAELVIAGGPPADHLDDDAEARRLVRLAEDAGVRDRVTFLGQVAHCDLPALYRSSDVVTCVPWYEPFGLVALEAMACGIPVVASAVGGLVDTVIDGVTGLHVRPRDPHAIAAALNVLLADDRRRAAFGSAGARRAIRRYRWSAIASETVHAYELAQRVGADSRRCVG